MIIPSSALNTPQDALTRLLAFLTPVTHEPRSWTEVRGRILAQTILSDRDSPPTDVSAMDGYAVRLADLTTEVLPVVGEITAGQVLPPSRRPAATNEDATASPVTMRIFTGAAVPAWAEAVIPREDVLEEPGRITLRVPVDFVRRGQHIRRRGENLQAGGQVLEPGTLLTPPALAALAAFGVTQVSVFQRVRLGLVITGNELADPGSTPEPWQIRDSNGPALGSLFAGIPWIDLLEVARVADNLAAIREKLERTLARCDALIVTGGVSAGDYDFVPAALAQLAGVQLLFHKLPIRPGKPILGALGPRGQPILALPGNPVSVLTTARYFGVPALLRVAGLRPEHEPQPHVQVAATKDPPSKLWWYRPVTVREPGWVEVVPSCGSGDLVSAARSAGMIEVPPGEVTGGWRRFWGWRV